HHGDTESTEQAPSASASTPWLSRRSESMDDHKGTSRRNFIKLATATGLAAGASRSAFSSVATHLIEPREQQTQTPSPSDRIRIATIGVGGQGTADTNAALRRSGATTDQSNPNPLGPGVELVAVADLYDGRLTR